MAYLGNTPGVSSQRLVTEFVATAGQTTFTPSGGYMLGYVDVLINGIELKDGEDFTASNGISVVLTSPAVAGDEVKIKTWLPRGLSDGYLKSEADSRFVNADGDTMTGPLVLPGNPTTNLQAAPKQYVDSAVDGVNLSSRVAKTGDTMSGALNIDTTLGSQQLTVKGVEADIHLISTGPNARWRILGSTGANTHLFRIYDDTNGADRLNIDASGRVRMPSQPHLFGRISRTSSSSGYRTMLVQSSRNASVSTANAVTNSRFTAQVAGVYSLKINAIYLNSSGRRDLKWYKNGAIFVSSLSEDSTTGFHYRSIAIDAYLNTGDYVEIFDAGGDLYNEGGWDSEWTSFSISLLS